MRYAKQDSHAEPAAVPAAGTRLSVPLTSDDRFRLLSEIGQLVADVSETTVDLALGRILEVLCTLTRAEGGSIFLVDHPTDELILLKSIGESFAEFTTTHHMANGAPVAQKELAREALFIQSVHFSDERSLTWIPLQVSSSKLGICCIINSRPVKLEEDDESFLRALTTQAALLIERSGYADSMEVSRAFANVFEASQLLHTSREVGALHQVLADSALRVSGADSVVLYEYFEEKGDVRIPPIIAGKMKAVTVLAHRGQLVAHRNSAVFRLLKYDKPFYAPLGYEDWRREDLISEEVGEERSFFKREQVFSSAGIPLRIDAERVGVLFFNYRCQVAFSFRMRERLELFSNQVALALGNARFFQRSESYGQKLKLLQDIGRELSMTVDLGISEILDVIDQQVRRVVPSVNFFLCLYDESRGQLELPYLRDRCDQLRDLLPDLNKGFASYVWRSGQPLLARREKIEELIAKGEAKCVGTLAKVWLGAPMIARQKVMGVIVVQDYEDEDAFNSDDLELLSLIALQAAVAIDNHRLLTELSALLKLSQEIGAGRLSLSTFLSSFLDQACQLAGCDGSLLSLRDPGGNGRLRVIASSRNLRHKLGKVIEFGDGVTGCVARTGQPLTVNDYKSWDNRSSLFEAPSEFPPSRVCGVPLFWRERVFGVITLASSIEGKFSEREVQLLERFAGPLAITIHNAHDSSFRRCLIHGSPHAIIAVDTEGRITELSDAAEQLFKYSRDELVGQMVRTLFWGRKKDREKIGDQIQQSGYFEGILFGRTKTRKKIPLSISASMLRDQEKKILGSMGIVEDLRLGSLRGRTRDLVKALGEINLAQDLNRLFELIVFHASDLLFGDAGCLFVKEGEVFALRAPLGTDDEHLKEWETLSAQSVIDEFARQERMSRPLAVDELDGLRLSRRSRSAIPALIRADRLLAILWIESQEVEHFREDQELLQTLVDQATQSINRLELLRERDKTLQKLMTTSNAISIGEIATGFLHETKNSLNGMTLSVLDLQESLQGESNLSAKNEYAQQLNDVLAEMKRLDDLARRLQGFTKQGLVPARQQVYLNEIIRRTLELLESTLRTKKIRYELKLDSALDQQVDGKGNPILVDEGQLQQVFMNLILNAVDASPARGRLLLESRNHPHQVEFRLADQGRGISDAEKSSIFNPFFTTKKEGTGLGLYISKILVEENHQGRIDVTSSPGKGAAFSVFIPKTAIERK